MASSSVEKQWATWGSRLQIPSEIEQYFCALTQRALSGASMKEFPVYLSSSTLVITFIPSNNSFAFLNALEVVSVPKSFITDNTSTVSTQLRKFEGLSMQAFAIDEQLC
ncbi:hypothetical protein LguiA_021037 [Lonicera macranthoides]